MRVTNDNDLLNAAAQTSWSMVAVGLIAALALSAMVGAGFAFSV